MLNSQIWYLMPVYKLPIFESLFSAATGPATALYSGNESSNITLTGNETGPLPLSFFFL